MFSHCGLLFALATSFQHVMAIMVEAIDGSFVPLSFVTRGPGDAFAVQMKNNHDLAYLVNSHRCTCVLS